MTAQAFIELSTRLVRDLTAWSEQAVARGTVSSDELGLLQMVAGMVHRATVTAASAGTSSAVGEPGTNDRIASPGARPDRSSDEVC